MKILMSVIGLIIGVFMVGGALLVSDSHDRNTPITHIIIDDLIAVVGIALIVACSPAILTN